MKRALFFLAFPDSLDGDSLNLHNNVQINLSYTTWKTCVNLRILWQPYGLETGFTDSRLGRIRRRSLCYASSQSDRRRAV